MPNEDDKEGNVITPTIFGIEYKTKNEPQYKPNVPNNPNESEQDIEGTRPNDHNRPRQEQFKIYEHKGADGGRRWVGRQKIAKKGGKDSRSVLVING